MLIYQGSLISIYNIREKTTLKLFYYFYNSLEIKARINCGSKFTSVYINLRPYVDKLLDT